MVERLTPARRTAGPDQARVDQKQLIAPETSPPGFATDAHAPLPIGRELPIAEVWNDDRAQVHVDARVEHQVEASSVEPGVVEGPFEASSGTLGA